MPSGLNELLNMQESALRVREARQELLASNIANADTPNYKARDINFSAALQQVSQANQGRGHGANGVTNGLANGLGPGPAAKLPLSVTSQAHQFGKNTSTLAGVTQFRNEQQGSIDGNDVNIDRERVQFADNGVRYEASVTLITAQIRNMLAVLQS